MTMPYLIDVAPLTPQQTLVLPDTLWENETIFDPIKQQRYRSPSAPNGQRRLWAREEPGCNAIYNNFRLHFIRYAKRSGISLNGLSFCPDLTLLRYFPGDSVRPHVDNGGTIIEGNKEKRVAFTGLWYASSTNLKGGDFVLPQQGVRLASTYGQRIIIDAGEQHAVDEVTEGVRIAIMLRLWTTKKIDPLPL